MSARLWGLPVFRSIYRIAVAWRYRLVERRTRSQPVLERVEGWSLVVLPDVLNPRLFYSGAFLARALDGGEVPRGARALDMGTGSGVAALAAARTAAYVVAVDINPAAVRCARINALLNEVEGRVDVREGDLFAPVRGERFDVVIFNPPYLRGEPRTMFERALYATDVIERFARDLAEHLDPAGYGLMLLSSLADEATFLALFRSQGFEVTVASSTQLPLETLTLYRLSLPTTPAASSQPGET